LSSPKKFTYILISVSIDILLLSSLEISIDMKYG